MKLKKILASVLSCAMLLLSSGTVITPEAAITNPQPMVGQEWTEGRYCVCPYDTLDYYDALKICRIDVDITAAIAEDGYDSIAGDVYAMDSWNARLNTAFVPVGYESDKEQVITTSGLGKMTLSFKRTDNATIFTSGTTGGTEFIITSYGNSEFSVDDVRYYDSSDAELKPVDDIDEPIPTSDYTISDLISLKKYLLNASSDNINSEKLDANKDNVLNALDASLIKSIILGFAQPPKEDLPDGMRDISAIDFVYDMKIGWNLGNTLDSFNSNWSSTPTPTQQETCWGNPVTTKAMIDEVKNAGFNTVRIPTTWFPSTGSAPDYKISDEWMNRVQEVVDYVIDNNMYCILNTHHEGSWLAPTTDKKDEDIAKLTKIWEQIAERFKNYDDHLIFEGLNEPRTEGSEKQWMGGTYEERQVLNELNQAFVDTIRNSGGNNKYRFLMVPAYAAGMYDSLIGFKVPNDDRVIVSVHNYFPYDFALNISGTSEWGTDQEYKDVTATMETLYDKFISKGRAVVMGECGAMNKNNDDVRAKWAEYFVSEARKKGITCVFWDNNVAYASNAENFGLLNRSSLTWYFPSVIQGIMKGAEQTREN